MYGEDVANQAVFIAKCESRLNNLAENHHDRRLNGHSSIGLMQISMIHGYDEEYLLNPYNNARVALSLYEKRDWQPWLNCFIKLKQET